MAYMSETHGLRMEKEVEMKMMRRVNIYYV